MSQKLREIGQALEYKAFLPKLVNLLASLGFDLKKTKPSVAFCSDDNQFYPRLLVFKHFGTAPFDHGRVGAVVAVDRHAPHAHHGRDIVIIHAAHVGYDPSTNSFGRYRRQETENCSISSACGKIHAVLASHGKGSGILEKNLAGKMQQILKSREPMLAAAIVHSRAEFKRTMQSIREEPEFKSRKVFFISGINIDISPKKGQSFPLTSFVPLAAYFKASEETIFTQKEICGMLNRQQEKNPFRIDIEKFVRG